MPSLAYGQVGFVSRRRQERFFTCEKIFHKAGFVVASAAFVITPKRFGDEPGVELEFGGEKFKEQFHEPQQRDAIGAFRARVQPVAEAQEGVEGGLGSAPASGAV